MNIVNVHFVYIVKRKQTKIFADLKKKIKSNFVWSKFLKIWTFTRGPTKILGRIGLAVMTFIGYKQTNKQTNKQTPKQVYIYTEINYTRLIIKNAISVTTTQNLSSLPLVVCLALDSFLAKSYNYKIIKIYSHTKI